MSERDLSTSLLRAGAAEQTGPLDGRDRIAQMLRRDRRRIRLLGGATLLLWLLGACGIAFVLYELYVHLPQYLAFRDEMTGTTSMERRQSITESYLAGSQIGFVVTSCSAAVLALAALGTFLLVLDTRRATLRQINTSLALISERLERLQELRERERPGQATPRDSHAQPSRAT
jgi:hypothetical protein